MLSLLEEVMKIGVKITPKNWGIEIKIVNNKLYAGKLLRIKAGKRTSLHMHRKKDETIYVLGGELLVELNGKRMILTDGDAIRIKPKTWHRLSARTECLLIEFSNPHRESDVVRIKDSLEDEEVV